VFPRSFAYLLSSPSGQTPNLQAALQGAPTAADNDLVGPDWHDFDPDELFAELRRDPGGPEGERLVWAFERALGVACVDEGLLEHTLVALVCLLARARGESPRTVLETFFRRAVSDERWQERFLPLFA
jgi:hypothetical protein